MQKMIHREIAKLDAYYDVDWQLPALVPMKVKLLIIMGTMGGMSSSDISAVIAREIEEACNAGR